MDLSQAALDELDRLAKSDRWQDRLVAAMYEHKHSALVNDPNWYVRAAVADFATDSDILRQLAGDKKAAVRAAVAQSSADTDLLRLLAKDSRRRVRLAVADYTTDLDVLKQLANDGSRKVRKAAQKSLNDILDNCDAV